MDRRTRIKAPSSPPLTTRSQKNLVGEVIDGRFVLMEPIGTTRSGFRYIAYDIQLLVHTEIAICLDSTGAPKLSSVPSRPSSPPRSARPSTAPASKSALPPLPEEQAGRTQARNQAGRTQAGRTQASRNPATRPHGVHAPRATSVPLTRAHLDQTPRLRRIGKAVRAAKPPTLRDLAPLPPLPAGRRRAPATPFDERVTVPVRRSKEPAQVAAGVIEPQAPPARLAPPSTPPPIPAEALGTEETPILLKRRKRIDTPWLEAAWFAGGEQIEEQATCSWELERYGERQSRLEQMADELTTGKFRKFSLEEVGLAEAP